VRASITYPLCFALVVSSPAVARAQVQAGDPQAEGGEGTQAPAEGAVPVRVGQRALTSRPTAVRELPRRRATLVVMLPAGTEVEVLETGRWWAHVRTEIHSGFAPLLNLVGVAASPAQEAAPAPGAPEPAEGDDTGAPALPAPPAGAAPDATRSPTAPAPGDGTTDLKRTEIAWKEAQATRREAETKAHDAARQVESLEAEAKDLETKLAAARRTGSGRDQAAAFDAKLREVRARAAARREVAALAGALADSARKREADAFAQVQRSASEESVLAGRARQLEDRFRYLEERSQQLEQREAEIQTRWREMETRGGAAGAPQAADPGTGAPDPEALAATAAHQSAVQALGGGSSGATPIPLEEELPRGPSRGGPVRVAVYELTATDIPASRLGLVTSAVLAEVRKLARVSAMGMNEVRALLSMEEQKQMVGCEDSESCVAEIAGALGVDYLVMGNVGTVGDSSVFSLKRISMSTSQVTHSFDKRTRGGEGEELLEAIGPAVHELFPDNDLRPGFTRGVPAEVVARWNPPPLKPWVFWTTAGLSAASMLTGGVLWAQAQAKRDDHNELLARSRAVDVQGRALKALRQDADRFALAGNAMAATAGALLVAAGVVGLFTDWHQDLIFGVGTSGGEGAPSTHIGVAGRF
jgi:hypothetical protein